MMYPRSSRCPVDSRSGAVGGADTGCFVYCAIGFRLPRRARAAPERDARHRTAPPWPYAGVMLLSLSNTPRDYAWGSRTLLAALEGREPATAPEAEVWFGDHPGDPADVAGGGTLDAVTGG